MPTDTDAFDPPGADAIVAPAASVQSMELVRRLSLNIVSRLTLSEVVNLGAWALEHRIHPQPSSQSSLPVPTETAEYPPTPFVETVEVAPQRPEGVLTTPQRAWLAVHSSFFLFTLAVLIITVVLDPPRSTQAVYTCASQSYSLLAAGLAAAVPVGFSWVISCDSHNGLARVRVLRTVALNAHLVAAANSIALLAILLSLPPKTSIDAAAPGAPQQGGDPEVRPLWLHVLPCAWAAAAALHHTGSLISDAVAPRITGATARALNGDEAAELDALARPALAPGTLHERLMAVRRRRGIALRPLTPRTLAMNTEVLCADTMQPHERDDLCAVCLSRMDRQPGAGSREIVTSAPEPSPSELAGTSSSCPEFPVASAFRAEPTVEPSSAQPEGLMLHRLRASPQAGPLSREQPVHDALGWARACVRQQQQQQQLRECECTPQQHDLSEDRRNDLEGAEGSAPRVASSMLIRRLRCGHAFHKECADAWLQHRALCPACRRAVVGPSSAEEAGASARGVAASSTGMALVGSSAVLSRERGPLSTLDTNDSPSISHPLPGTITASTYHSSLEGNAALHPVKAALPPLRPQPTSQCAGRPVQLLRITPPQSETRPSLSPTTSHASQTEVSARPPRFPRCHRDSTRLREQRAIASLLAAHARLVSGDAATARASVMRSSVSALLYRCGTGARGSTNWKSRGTSGSETESPSSGDADESSQSTIT